MTVAPMRSPPSSVDLDPVQGQFAYVDEPARAARRRSSSGRRGWCRRRGSGRRGRRRAAATAPETSTRALVAELPHAAASLRGLSRSLPSPASAARATACDDRHVRAAAAQVAAHPLADLLGGQRRRRPPRAVRRRWRRSASPPRAPRSPRWPNRSGPGCSSRTGSRRGRGTPAARGAVGSPSATPSMVVISRPSAATASCRQETARRPSSSTVQAPHWPWSQPFLVPVRSSRSRRASSRVVRWSTDSVCFSPLMFRVMALDVEWGHDQPSFAYPASNEAVRREVREDSGAAHGDGRPRRCAAGSRRRRSAAMVRLSGQLSA